MTDLRARLAPRRAVPLPDTCTMVAPLSPLHLGLPVVCLVDDEPVLRDALGWLLRSRRLLSEPFANAESFEAWLAQRQASSNWPDSPTCLLLDVRMPGTSGLVLFERLAERGVIECMPVIFLTGHGDVPMAVSAVKRGAFDFVEKPFSDNALVDRIECALAASADAIRAAHQRRHTARAVAELTEREHEVMQRVIEGLANKLIADQLDISVRTVEVHRARVFEKMNVRSAVELANLLRDPG